MLIGVIVNAAAVAAGGILGSILHKGIPEKMNQLMMQGLSLCVLYVGISGSLEGNNTIVVVLSIVFGAVIGELFNLDGKLQSFGDFLQSKVKSDNPISEGFITCSLFVCVGAMAIVGSLQSGLTGNNETLFTKGLIDGIIAMIMASTMGIGVAFAAVPLFIYQGILTVSAGAISGYLTMDVINEITCTGSLLIIAIAFNMLKLTNIKTANLLLAPFLPILFCRFF